MGSRHYQATTRFTINLDAVLDDAERRDRKAAEHVRETVRQLQGLMTPEAYNEWWESAPENNVEFLAATEKKLSAELVSWEQEERYTEMIAARRAAFVAQIRERKAGPCEFGSLAWLAGMPDDDELGEAPFDTRREMGV